MSTITEKPEVPAMPPVRMTVEAYEKTAFYDDQRIELIDGYIVRRDEMKPAHAAVTGRLRRRIDRILPVGWSTREDKPVRIPPLYEPLPDIAGVRGDDENYLDHHPGPGDIAFLVEISDATLSKDQGKKLATYAQNDIPIYWIVNLVDRQVEVYTDPRPNGYGMHLVFKAGQSVPVVVEGREVGQIDVTDILPPEVAAGNNGT
jgi:Putative restriction endonuclease